MKDQPSYQESARHEATSGCEQVQDAIEWDFLEDDREWLPEPGYFWFED